MATEDSVEHSRGGLLKGESSLPAVGKSAASTDTGSGAVLSSVPGGVFVEHLGGEGQC